MNKFDKIQQGLFRVFDLMGCSYEIHEYGDTKDNWYLEVEVDTGDNDPILLKIEDITDDEDEEYTIEDHIDEIEERLTRLEAPALRLPSFMNEACPACASRNTFRIYYYSSSSPDWTYRPYVFNAFEKFQCGDCGNIWNRSCSPDVSFTQTEWGTVSCGGDCQCTKEEKPLTESQLRTHRESKRY